MLGNFSSRPEACCRGARDIRGEHQERFRPGLPIIACPLARPYTFVLQGIPDLLGNGQEMGKASPPSQIPSSHSPNLDPPKPR